MEEDLHAYIGGGRDGKEGRREGEIEPHGSCSHDTLEYPGEDNVDQMNSGVITWRKQKDGVCYEGQFEGEQRRTGSCRRQLQPRPGALDFGICGNRGVKVSAGEGNV